MLSKLARFWCVTMYNKTYCSLLSNRKKAKGLIEFSVVKVKGQKYIVIPH